jgi:hypothetical protein
MNTNEFYEQFRAKEKETNETRAKASASKPAEVLTMKIGGTYLMRLIPVLPIDYDVVGFNSRLDGSYQFIGLSPSSISLGDNAIKNDPVKKQSWKSWAAVKDSNDKDAQREALQLVPKTKKMMNVYLISDSLEPANDGKNKVLDFGAGFNSKTKEPAGNIWKKLHEGLEGDSAADYGAKLFDLGKDGVNIRIKVKEKVIGNKKIPEYQVDFIPGKPAEALSAAAQKEVIANAYDLTKYLPELKPLDEIQKILDIHWNGNEPAEVDIPEIPTNYSDDDNLDFGTDD